jgi:beta-glucosidase
VWPRQCCDRYDVQWPGAQLPFIQAVAALGKPLVLVTVNAGMLNLSWPLASPAVPAILNANYLAQFAGQAIAETVLGLNNPSGRLTSTYYASAADIADIHNYSLAATHMTYRFLDAAPMLPFGFGLSYSRFTYSDLTVTPAGPVAPCDWVNVSVTVTNVAGPAGAEVVQLYLSTQNASVPLPVRQLTNWARVQLAAGAATTVTLAVTAEDMAVMRNGDFALQIEPGQRSLWVGASSDVGGNGLAGTFTVVGPVTPFAACPAAARVAVLPTRQLGDGKWSPPVMRRRA